MAWDSNESVEPETVTEQRRALDLFIDRVRPTRRFLAYLNDDPPPGKILFFYGDGGNGKSLLLRYLEERCLKRLDRSEWTRLGSMGFASIRDESAFKGAVEAAKSSVAVPSVSIDFGAGGGTYQHQDAYTTLLTLHRYLTEHGLHFPLYGWAVVHYLTKTRQLSDEQLKNLFPAEEMTFLAELANLGTHAIPYAGFFRAVLDVANRRLSGHVRTYIQRRQIAPGRLEALEGMDAERDLLPRLPSLFAEDLIAAMSMEGAPTRLVLFFDTHEAFWGLHHDYSPPLYFERDEWLRRLLLPLAEHPCGVVTVVAGRDKPRWAEAGKYPIPDTKIETHLVGGLTEAYARTYLDQAGIDITDPTFQQSLLEFTRTGDDEIHPFYLGLCADIVIAARQRGEHLGAEDFATVPETAMKGKILLDRLRLWVDKDLFDGISALSVCRSFNREIYFVLADALGLRKTRSTYDTLTRFSFVRTADTRGNGWSRVHELMRRLIREQGGDLLREADAVMESYYRERQDNGSVVEAIYHANRLEWERGVKEWSDTFKEALTLSHYDLCRALRDVRKDLSVPDAAWRGILSQDEGEYSAQLALYTEAEQAYVEALEAYDAALRLAPNDVGTLSDKGLALASLGDLQAELGRHEDAAESYHQAIAAYDAALRLAPNDVVALSNKGLALASLGDLQAELGRHEDAAESYHQAIAAYDAALRLAPNDVAALSDKGVALASLGDLQAGLGRHEDAAESYHQAIAAYDVALRLAPNDVDTLSDKGNALASLGDLQAELGRHEDAAESYHQAIAAYDAALRLAPNHIAALSNKGNALQRLGGLQAGLGRHEDAAESYHQAIAAYDAALRLAPNHVAALSNKGVALASLGGLQAGLGRHEDAAESYRQAIAAYDAALRLAPNHIAALNNKGNALQRRAGLHL